MALKFQSSGNIPAVNLEYKQLNSFVFTTQEKAPYIKSVTARVREYGLAADGTTRIFDAHELPPMSIPVLEGWMQTKVPTNRQAEAVLAYKKIQEGLGTLIDVYYGTTFTGAV